jgi:hypothetical protein
MNVRTRLNEKETISAKGRGEPEAFVGLQPRHLIGNLSPMIRRDISPQKAQGPYLDNIRLRVSDGELS